MDKKDLHWADLHASLIIEKNDKDKYTCASGITPSGTIHIGNFREIISVELVTRALKKLDKEARFIYSWDDYDVFRKVPKNMPKQELLKSYLRQPVTNIPDVFDEYDNYAEKCEKDIEKCLPKLGIFPEYLYQAKKYRNSEYAEGMKIALENKALIINILNESKTGESKLDNTWWPISIFSSFTNKDNTKIISWDKEYNITYQCLDTNKTETIDLKTTSLAKLHWRLDWPMRWNHEKVDFEPAGKEHHSAGGSFDTAKKIAKQIYNKEAPHTFKYDFIINKGGGKMSSSSGELASISDVLKIYTPEITRYMFASTIPNKEFTIDFGLEVIKNYEDYDKCERIYYTLEESKKNKKPINDRIYELSQINTVQKKAPLQIPFRYFSNLIQVNENIDLAIEQFLNENAMDKNDLDSYNLISLQNRGLCIKNWLNYIFEMDTSRLEKKYNKKCEEYIKKIEEFLKKDNDETKYKNGEPVKRKNKLKDLDQDSKKIYNDFKNSVNASDFIFILQDQKNELNFSNLEKEILAFFIDDLKLLTDFTEKNIENIIYNIKDRYNIDIKEIFKLFYKALTAREKGPKLAKFIVSISKSRVIKIINNYL